MPKKKKDNGRKEALKDLAKRMIDLRTRLNGVDNSCLKRGLAILNDKRKDSIRFTGSCFRIGDKGSTRAYTGLTKVLPELFWPETASDPRKRSREEVSRRKNTEHYVPSFKQKGKKRCKGYGAKHGSKVHSEVCKFVRKIAAGKMIRTVSDKLDPCTVRIINLLATQSYFPIASEHPIYDELSCVATAFDVIAIDVKRELVVGIEVKTGEEAEQYDEHPTDGRMRAPLNNVVNCPRNRHATQLLGTLLIAKDRHGYQIDDGYVLRSCPKQQNAQLLPLPEWAKDKTVHASVLSALRKRR